MKFVDPRDLKNMWHLVEHDIQRACKYASGTYDSDDALQMLIMGECLLWMILDDKDNYVAHMITEVHEHPKKKVLFLRTTGGKDLYKWRHMCLETLIKTAEHYDCDFIETSIRPGLKDHLEEIGFKQTRITMEFEYERRKR